MTIKKMVEVTERLNAEADALEARDREMSLAGKRRLIRTKLLERGLSEAFAVVAAAGDEVACDGILGDIARHDREDAELLQELNEKAPTALDGKEPDETMHR